MLSNLRIRSNQCKDLWFMLQLWIAIGLFGLILIIAIMFAFIDEDDRIRWYGILIPAVGVLIAAIVKFSQDLLIRANERVGAYEIIVADIVGICSALSVFELEEIEPNETLPADKKVLEWKVKRFACREENYFEIFQQEMSSLTGLNGDTLMHITQFYTLLKASRDSALALASWNEELPEHLAHSETRRVFVVLLQCLREAKLVLEEFDPALAANADEIVLVYKRAVSSLEKASV